MSITAFSDVIFVFIKAEANAGDQTGAQIKASLRGIKAF